MSSIETKVIIAPQKNASRNTILAPATGYPGTIENMMQLKEEGFAVAGLTEMWSYINRRAMYKIFPKSRYGFVAPLLNSSILIWDKEQERAHQTWVIDGHPALRGVTDHRRVPYAALEHIPNGDEPAWTRLFGVPHPTPIPTVKAPDKVPAAHDLQSLFWHNQGHFLCTHVMPSWLIGDLNDDGKPMGDHLMDGRHITYTGEGIIKHITIPGPHVAYGAIQGKQQVIPSKRSDHPLIVQTRIARAA